CTHAVLPAMIKQGYGKIVTIASDAGRVGSTGEAVYSAAKGGLIAFTKTIARETARHQFTLIWCRAVSRAIVLVNAMRPPLAAEYTASPVEPTRPASEAIVTILPPSCLIMTRSAARMQAMGPL